MGTVNGSYLYCNIYVLFVPSLYAVSMDVVSAHGSSVKEVNSVEQCECPPPYTGLSCQVCRSKTLLCVTTAFYCI